MTNESSLEALRRIEKLTEGAADEKEDFDGTFAPLGSVEGLCSPSKVERAVEEVQKIEAAKVSNV